MALAFGQKLVDRREEVERERRETEAEKRLRDGTYQPDENAQLTRADLSETAAKLNFVIEQLGY